MAFSEEHHDQEGWDEEEEPNLQPSAEKLEIARQQFEQMMAMPNDNKEHNEKEMQSQDSEEDGFSGTKTIKLAVLSNQKSPPPLTTMLKERRMKEIQLLSTLSKSDKAINDLWALWIAERGRSAAARILEAEEQMSVESWNEAEQTLLSLIDEYGIHWAEPLNRLATLYYMQGKNEESKALCELVLDIKPWHFGALSGIVMVCTAMNDAAGARYWAEKRLPPGPSEKRSAWTNTVIEKAKQSLQEAALVGRKPIGQEEVEFRRFRAHLEETVNIQDVRNVGDESVDAWQ